MVDARQTPSLTFADVLAFRDAVARAAGPEPRMMYVTRAAWLDLGGDPALFDTLPIADFGDGEDRGLRVLGNG